MVLGHYAASQLGIGRVNADTRVWLGGHWFSVAGVLDPFELAPEIDRAALIGLPIAAEYFGYDGHPTRLYRTAPQQRAALAGGGYTVELSANAPSFINVPLADPGTLRTCDTDWGPSS